MFHVMSLDKKNKVFSKYNLENENAFRKFNKINIFVGANNSGKSWLLRELYKVLTIGVNKDKPTDKDIDFDLADSDQLLTMLTACFASAKTQLPNTPASQALEEKVKIFMADLTKEKYINYGDSQKIITHYPAQLQALIKTLFTERGNNSVARQKINREKTFFSQAMGKFSEQLHSLINERLRGITYHTTYVPMLRGLRKVNSQNEEVDNYKFRTHSDYFKGLDYQKSDVFTGIKLYDDIKKLLLSDYDQRQAILEFETFLSNNYFNGDRVSLIPREYVDKEYARDNAENERNSDIYIKIGQEEEFPIYQLGDGIHSIIILTFPLFAYRNQKHIYFIEEPELSLHPGMQRTFIETIKQFEHVQVFLATHSNHFLDMTLEAGSDISVFSFRKKLPDGAGQRKKADFIVQNVTNPDESVLELIGVRNSSVFLSNCTIWVEGVTDRYYIRKYLELYQLYQKELKESKKEKFKEYKEDIHFSFVEYSGSNITHWSFLDDQEENPIHKNINVDRVCGKLFLITDKDKGKEERQEKLMKRLGEKQYYCLQRKEIENLLTPEIIKATVEIFEENKHNKEKLNFNNFSYEDYAEMNVGELIDNNLLNRKVTTYQDKKTLIRKGDFAKHAIGEMKSINDMSPDARKIAELLYAFIDSKN